MIARRPLHVACSPLTKKIYAGSKSADGKLWLSDQTDVTAEALLAVVEMIGPGFRQALIARNGGPSFEIEVREIPTPASGMEAEGRDAQQLGAKPDSPIGKAETPHSHPDPAGVNTPEEKG